MTALNIPSYRCQKPRFIVETVFGRIKRQFRIAAELVNNLNIPRFLDQLQILCAIINKYHPRVTADRDHEDEICERIISRMRLPNNLYSLILGERITRVTLPFRAYNPRENLFRQLGRNDPYFLATGTYHLKLIDQYKARFREMKLEPEVRDY